MLARFNGEDGETAADVSFVRDTNRRKPRHAETTML